MNMKLQQKERGDFNVAKTVKSGSDSIVFLQMPNEYDLLNRR